MTQPRQYFERHSVRQYLEGFIPTLSWTGVSFREGFQSEEEIQPPLIAVTVLPSRMIELQMGRSLTTNKSFMRLMQVDCYMETEPRAMTIADDVADAIDRMHIDIQDPSGTNLGALYCSDSEAITIDIIRPDMREPRVKRWRAVIQFPVEAHYLDD